MKWFVHKNSCWTNPNNFSRQKKASRGGPTGEDNPLDAWKCRQQTWSFRRRAWGVLLVGSLWGTSDVIGLLVSNGGVLTVSDCAHSHLQWSSFPLVNGAPLSPEWKFNAQWRKQWFREIKVCKKWPKVNPYCDAICDPILIKPFLDGAKWPKFFAKYSSL